MSEIKVGDICNVSGYARYCDQIEHIFLDDEKCKIIFIEKHPKITIRAFKGSGRPFFVHRKQCRKLVKMRKCDGCDGVGKCIRTIKHWSGSNCEGFFECDKCNGNGKIASTKVH